jgi:hypothetical protein
MCALAPSHAVIPADGVQGVTLQSDGSLEFLANNALFLPDFVPLFAADSIGEPDQPRIPPYQWSISSDGRLLSKSELSFPGVGGWLAGFDAISPDGSWLAGVETEDTGDFILNGKNVVWRRGTNDLIPLELPPGTYGPVVRGVSNEGDVIYWAGVAGETASFVRDRNGVVHALPSLYPKEASNGPGTSPVLVMAISADGQTIVGGSGGGGFAEALPPRATIWKNGIAQELPSGGYSQSYATTVSDDGRIVGGSVSDGAISRAAVWVDGILQQSLVDDPRSNGALQVIHGVGGDPAAWAALGFNWIALSDGVLRPFDSGLFESYGLSLTGSQRGVELLANDDALYLVTMESPVSTAVGTTTTTTGQLATHVLILPTDFTYSPSEAFDISGDHHVSPLDALLVINALNEHPNTALFDLPAVRQAIPKIDTNGDGELSAIDALRIINYLNDSSPAGADNMSANNIASAEGEAPPSNSAFPTDDYFNLLGSDSPRRKR